MSSFEIGDGPVEIALANTKGDQLGSTSFNLTSRAPAKVNARLSVRPTGAARADWLVLGSEPLRVLDVGETIVVPVDVRAPANAPPGRGGLILRVVNENDSNNDWAESAERTFTLKPGPQEEAAPAKRKPLLAIALVGLLALGGTIALLSGEKPNDPAPIPRPTITPRPTFSPTPRPTLEIAIAEDCIAFGPAPVEVVFVAGRWKIVSGSHWIFDFGSTPEGEAEARQALATINAYGATETCYVGRPDPSFIYLRTPAQSIPSGPVGGEDCVGISPDELSVEASGSRWTVLSGGNHAAFSAPDEAEARKIVAILKKYDATRSCYVGRPDPSLSYVRR